MTIADNKLYFADKEIVIGQQEIVPLNLTETSGEVIKTKMKAYGK
jgi:hypothetical protein